MTFVVTSFALWGCEGVSFSGPARAISATCTTAGSGFITGPLAATGTLAIGLLMVWLALGAPYPRRRPRPSVVESNGSPAVPTSYGAFGTGGEPPREAAPGDGRPRGPWKVLAVAVIFVVLVASGALLLTRDQQEPEPELLALRTQLNWAVSGVNCVWHHGDQQEAQRTWMPELRRRLAQAVGSARLDRREVDEAQRELYRLGLGVLEDALALVQGRQRDVYAMNGTLGVFHAGVLELEGAPQSEIDAAKNNTTDFQMTRQECRTMFVEWPA